LIIKIKLLINFYLWKNGTYIKDNTMIDAEGYRPNVGIVILNDNNKVLWAKRVAEDAWQFPQGGVDEGESLEEAMYRELMEEVGLSQDHVEIIGKTKNWLRYDVPRQWVRRDGSARYKGQKQIWFLLKFIGKDSDIVLNNSVKPEFDSWRWDDFWSSLDKVIDFKREVYERALSELSIHLPKD
jgi:putative (di)nucleoside polyphosphate hydrolase